MPRITLEEHPSIIFHIDVNSAFLSWTATDQMEHGAAIDIRQVPAIIGGDRLSRHGIVLAKSNEAKKYGIHTADPVASALKKCPNLIVEPPDFKLYTMYSKKLMKYLQSFTPDIEQVSIDECYMDFTGIAYQFESPIEGARIIKDGVREGLGFTVNIGISSNKLLAKMASDFKKPDWIHTLFPEEIQEKMWPLPVSDLYMAGHSSVTVLQKLEINTIGDLAKADPEILKLHLKSHGQTLWEFANGIASKDVSMYRDIVKGVGNSTTLSKDIVSVEEARKVLLNLADSVAKRLRKAEQKAGMVSVEIKYSTFQKVSRQRQLTRTTNNADTIYREACVLFEELWSGEPARLLGIRTSKLEEKDAPEQLSLFDYMDEMPQSAIQNQRMEKSEETEPDKQVEHYPEKPSREKLEKLDVAMDEIRTKFGETAITRGSQLGQKKREQLEH